VASASWNAGQLVAALSQCIVARKEKKSRKEKIDVIYFRSYVIEQA
jgi:hypothetical protein